MLKLSVSPTVEALRREFITWLDKNPPPQGAERSFASFMERGRAWQKLLAGGRWVGVHWPEEFGGRSRSLVEEAVLQEELARRSSPQLLGLFGLTMVGPVLIRHGTDEQRRRFLPKILDASEIWCQGFSEPGAGSDLAAIKTRAVVTDTGFRITGSKIWTSFAHIADWCFVLCRTSDEGDRYRGLSYLLVPMNRPGISTRPLKQISGDEEFNEVYFDDVEVPRENVVGKVGEGWAIAISTLMYERVVLTFARQLQSETALRGLVSDFHRNESMLPASELGGAVAKACAVRALAYDHLLHYASGREPGPEGSLDKLIWSESFQEIAELALRGAGLEGAGGESDVDAHRYLYSRGRTIAAGTSEIQRNIIAERLLGLPRLTYKSKD